ncbi:family 2 glycosyl transferase, partial [Streptomyces sp. NPDC055078]
AAIGPLLAAANWMIGGAAGPLERRDPVQVPAFVAEESDTRDQPRTLVLGGTSAAKVPYTLVRGSGSRLGDAELAAAGGGDARLDRVVAHLVAGSGADQTSQLSGFAIRYVLVRDGAPRRTIRVLDTTPGLSRLSQLDGSALWRVDRQVARATIVSAGKDPLPVASGAVEARATLRPGPEGRVLRIADRADEGWQATLDGSALKKTTVDGWAQGFELPREGGRLRLTYENSTAHTGWLWAQGFLALVLVVLALPGRRVEIDDDLPEETIAVPTQPVDGEGRRARRLRAQAAETPVAATGPPPPGPYEYQYPEQYQYQDQNGTGQPYAPEQQAQPSPADGYRAAPAPAGGGYGDGAYEQPYPTGYATGAGGPGYGTDPGAPGHSPGGPGQGPGGPGYGTGVGDPGYGTEPAAPGHSPGGPGQGPGGPEHSPGPRHGSPGPGPDQRTTRGESE